MQGTPPLIAIDGELVVEKTPALQLPLRYAEAVRRAGGFPLVLPPLASEAFLDQLLERIDGVLLSGGDDFETESLGLGSTHPAAKPVPGEKQAFDLRLAREVLERRIPVLGVCYGMQALALASGAALHQHLPDDLPGSRDHRGGIVHGVRLTPGSKLAELFGVAEVDVISRHHQALASGGDGWAITAVDDQGLIEGIERREHPFALGVQWHPELALDGDDEDRQLALFRGLVEAAREHHSERTQGTELEELTA